jgi:hypothetical protein
MGTGEKRAMTRPTYLLIEDIDDAPNPPRNIEEEQRDNLQAALGLTLWAALCEMEYKNV